MTLSPTSPPPPRKQDSKGLLGRVTGAVTGRVVDTIDPDAVLEHIDIDAIVERIDVNALIDRVDLDRLLARIDIDQILQGVDLERVLARVDLAALVRRTGIPDIVAESTGAMAGSALDVARGQLAGLDVLVDRLVDKLFRRDPSKRVSAPRLLREESGG